MTDSYRSSRNQPSPADSNDPLVEYCRSLAGATEDVKWDNDLVFSVGGKMFAAFPIPPGDPLSFKVDALAFPSLVEQDAIEPAPYLARHHWIRILDRGPFERAVLEAFLADSHRLVAAKLPKKTQKALKLEGLFDAEVPAS